MAETPTIIILSSSSSYDAKLKAAISLRQPSLSQRLCFLNDLSKFFAALSLITSFHDLKRLNQLEKGHFSPQTHSVPWLFHPMAGGLQLSFGRLM